MTFTEKHIVKTYSKLFNGLNEDAKIELIENLSKSLKSKKKEKMLVFMSHLVPFFNFNNNPLWRHLSGTDVSVKDKIKKLTPQS